MGISGAVLTETQQPVFPKKQVVVRELFPAKEMKTTVIKHAVTIVMVVLILLIIVVAVNKVKAYFGLRTASTTQ